MNIEEIIRTALLEEKFIYGVLSTPRDKSSYRRINLRPLLLKGSKYIQVEKFTKTQVFHENLPYEDAANQLISLVNEYRNGNIFTTDVDYQLLVSKKGSMKIIKKEATKTLKQLDHNKKKQYIISEDQPCDFLIHLGVMSKEGRVYAKMYDKFKQINKFLEIVDDSLKDRTIKDDFMIIDFGCGKAYLTFALYYYFYYIRKIKANIIGLDLKEEVIEFCNETAQKLNYHNLKFMWGDIRNFQYKDKVDMMVALHACDIATDAALVKAIKWDTETILSVPCCQHEFFDKIENEQLNPMLKHGLIKERVSSLVTDSLRSLFLESKGYKVQLMEFVSMEHTPKNILIRATKTKKDIKAAEIEYENFKKFWNLKDLFIESYYQQ
ncbi:MAG: SAM-dependent methyltransferase [Tissierellia bacterium]|nr:SAM-dependent methyltransferase [Tissierellia bacterium]